MSYAIIRNTKYKRENLKGIFRHNERRNKNYSNENIDKEKSYLNYSLKSPQYSYEKEFDRIREKYNIPLAIHKDDIEMLASAELNSSTVIEEPITVKNPEIIFDKDETKETSFCKYSVIHTPGHSKGSVCILIDDMLFAGDTVFYGSIGRTDLFGGDYDAIISSLNKIKALPKETKIFPGHGPVTTLERELYHNPYFK